jgi:hypothetical protein
MDGPMMRLPLTIEELSAMAFGRSRRSPIISLTNACRAGVSNALMTPCRIWSATICTTVMCPASVRTASNADCTSEAACVITRIRRRSTRSTRTPAKAAMSSVGT